jgi:hypothetical protein
VGTLDQYRARLASEPLTVNQLGRIHREFERLGFGAANRAERLEISAALARYPGRLASTKDLTMGEAGRLIGVLQSCRNLPDLYAATRAARPAPRPGWRQLIAALAAALHTMQGMTDAGSETSPAATCWHQRTERHGGAEPWSECGRHGDCVDSGPCDCPCLTCLDCGSHLYLRNPAGHGHSRYWTS